MGPAEGRCHAWLTALSSCTISAVSGVHQGAATRGYGQSWDALDHGWQVTPRYRSWRVSDLSLRPADRGLGRRPGSIRFLSRNFGGRGLKRVVTGRGGGHDESREARLTREENWGGAEEAGWGAGREEAEPTKGREGERERESRRGSRSTSGIPAPFDRSCSILTYLLIHSLAHFT